MSANPSKRLRAVSIAPRARLWLEQTHQAHILYVFERVINVVNQEGDVLALANHHIGPGPFSLVLEENRFPDDVDADASLLVFENGFWLGEWLIDAVSAELWHPTPNWGAAQAQWGDFTEVAVSLAGLLREYAPLDSFARLLLDPLATSTLPSRILQVAEQNIPLLFSGISGANLAAISTAAKSLAGMGPGLTPAGDDLLLGAMHGLWATRPEAAAFSATIAAAAAPRTHALSAAWLTAAAAGEAAAPWHDLVTALARQDRRALQAAALRILPTGHTSGADSLAGFLGVLQNIANE
ncbi:MAG TPA: DUF2877 domain-containing protein [Anaerolineales bacterium]